MPGYALAVAPARAVETPLWRALAGAAEPASIAELHRRTRAHPNAIQHRLDRWVRAGLVARLEGRPKRYRMTDAAPITAQPPRVDRAGRTAPRTASQRERLWRAMRVLPRFDIPTLRIVAEVSRRSAEDLVNCLHRGGYLRQLARGNSQRGDWSSYQLIRNTGPRPPAILHGHGRRELVDGNTGARVDISPAAVSLRKRRSATPVDGGVG